jgi:ribosome-binding factor A
MMESMRLEKVSALIQESLSEIISREVKDPRVEWATITKVRVSPDLRLARISVSTIQDEQHLQDMIIALNKMRSFLQNKLNKMIRLKFIPVLHFYPDRNIPYAMEMMKKIEKILPELKADNEE